MNRLLHDCKRELQEHTLKATPARLAVLKLLESTDKPLDVTAITQFVWQQQVDADPATIFRIMNILTEHGIIKQLQLGEGKFRYEYASKTDHHHLVCTHCGDIEDISDCNIGALEKEINKKKKFLVKSHSLEFFGICQQCQH